MRYNLHYLEGWLSIVINIVLFIFKLLIGLATNSIAIMADAWHTLSDSLTSVVVIVGAKASSKEKDEKHPYGHGRIELIASIIIGVLLCVAGGNFLLESISKLFILENFIFDKSIIVIFSLSVVLKEGIAQFSFWAAKKTNSQSLKADGWHHRSDAIASLLILISLSFGNAIPGIDAIIGILVAILIVYTAINIIKESSNPLIGEKLKIEIEDNIKELIVITIGPDINAHHFHYHRYGDHKELSFHITMPGHLSIADSHCLIDEVEKKIKGFWEIDATIHCETEVLLEKKDAS